MDPTLLNRLAGWAGFLSRAEVDDSVIRAIASPRQQKLNQGSVYTDYGGQIDKTLPNIVTRHGRRGDGSRRDCRVSAMDVVRQSLPMILALLKMALVICIPLVLVVGTYDLKTVVTVSVVQFALFFTDFWFQLARWIDSTILDALYGWGFGWNRPHTNFDPLVGLNNAFGDMLPDVRHGHDVPGSAGILAGEPYLGWDSGRARHPGTFRWQQERRPSWRQGCRGAHRRKTEIARGRSVVGVQLVRRVVVQVGIVARRLAQLGEVGERPLVLIRSICSSSPSRRRNAQHHECKPKRNVEQHPSTASLATHTSAVAPARGMPLDTNQFDARRSRRA